MIALKNAQRLFSSSIRDRLLKGAGMQRMNEHTIPEDQLPKFYAKAVAEL